MNTEKKLGRPRSPWPRILAAGLALALSFALMAAALPKPAQADVICKAYHLVREGDTKPRIAYTYFLRWKQIAAANGLKPADKLVVGARLCIPDEASRRDRGTAPGSSSDKTLVDYPEGEKNALIEITISNGKVRIHTNDFSDDHGYLVKARDVDQGIGGWFRLGIINVDEDEDQRFSFDVPSALRGEPVLRVCLKDQSNDELICRWVYNR